MTYAIPPDVEDRIGRTLDPTQMAQVEAWLDDVEALIRLRIPTLTDLVSSGKIPLGIVVMVECAAVIRVARNPDGKLTERIDDYSWTRDTSTASGRLYLTDEEWAMLSPLQPTAAFSIRPHYEPGRRRWPRRNSAEIWAES